MIEPVTVWGVRLGTGAREVRGTLALEAEHLAFDHDKATQSVRIPLSAVSKVKRVVGSPVLVVAWADADTEAMMAFYFSRPPPIDVPSEERRSKHRRKHRRQSAQYLLGENADKRDAVKRWRKALIEAVRGARAD